MAAPSGTSNQTLFASQSLNNATPITANLDIRTKWEARIQFANTGGGSVSAGSVLQIDVYRHVDGTTSNPDNLAAFTFTITTVQSALQTKSVALPTGSYQVKLTNTDGSNAITVAAIYETTDSVA